MPTTFVSACLGRRELYQEKLALESAGHLLSLCPSTRAPGVAVPFSHPFSRAFPWQEQCDNLCCIPILQNQQQQGGHREPQSLELCQLALPCAWWHPLGLELVCSHFCFLFFLMCVVLWRNPQPRLGFSGSTIPNFLLCFQPGNLFSWAGGFLLGLFSLE